MATKNNENNNRAQDIPEREKETVDEKQAKEIGGPKGPEPTRYGDWERKGRCIDF